MIKRIQINKLEAARRQMETAIRLYFVEGDTVSIHTLVSAAYQILSDINRKQGGTPMLKEKLPTWVRQDATTEAKRRLSEAANYFKHAERDHKVVLSFNPGQTELFLFDACVKYKELTNETIPDLFVYQAWFAIKNASLTKDIAIKQLLLESHRILATSTRQAFYADVLPLASEITIHPTS